MNQIYYHVGFFVFWISSIIGSLILIGYLFKIIINQLGKKFKMLWILVDFAFYRRQFKEWLKNKNSPE